MSKVLFLFGLTILYSLSFTSVQAQRKHCYACRGINCLRTTIQKNYETCEDSLDDCVTIFDKFAIVAKGCLSSLPIELTNRCNGNQNPECQVCSGDLCNTMGRHDYKCYQCDERDNNNSKCATNLEAMTPTQCLAPTSLNSYCFTKKKDGFTIRGCSINVKDQSECLHDTSCSLCLADDGEGCNSKQMAAAGVSKVSSVIGLLFLCVSMTRILNNS